ncbi:MAG: hypothetical protein WC752_03310 [Patescibacteria group bacterium]|jgi:hypothetical protein
MPDATNQQEQQNQPKTPEKRKPSIWEGIKIFFRRGEQIQEEGAKKVDAVPEEIRPEVQQVVLESTDRIVRYLEQAEREIQEAMSAGIKTPSESIKQEIVLKYKIDQLSAQDASALLKKLELVKPAVDAGQINIRNIDDLNNNAVIPQNAGAREYHLSPEEVRKLSEQRDAVDVVGSAIYKPDDQVGPPIINPEDLIVSTDPAKRKAMPNINSLDPNLLTIQDMSPKKRRGPDAIPPGAGNLDAKLVDGTLLAIGGLVRLENDNVNTWQITEIQSGRVGVVNINNPKEKEWLKRGNDGKVDEIERTLTKDEIDALYPPAPVAASSGPTPPNPATPPPPGAMPPPPPSPAAPPAPPSGPPTRGRLGSLWDRVRGRGDSALTPEDKEKALLAKMSLREFIYSPDDKEAMIAKENAISTARGLYAREGNDANKNDYRLKINEYRAAIKEAINRKDSILTPEKKKQFLDELYILTVVDEATALYEAQQQAQRESQPDGIKKKGKELWARFTNHIDNRLNWYRGLSWKKKIAVSAGLMGIGLAGGFAGGAIGASAVGAAAAGGYALRLLGATVMAKTGARLGSDYARKRQQRRDLGDIQQTPESAEYLAETDLAKIESLDNALNDKLSSLLQNQARDKRNRLLAATGGAVLGAGASIGIGQVGRYLSHDIVGYFQGEAPTAEAPVEPAGTANTAEAMPPTSNVAPEAPSTEVIRPVATHYYTNEIEGTTGRDYESKSLLQLIEAHKTDLGYDSNTDGDPDKWVRHEFRTAMAELKGKGQWYDLTHQGDRVVLQVNPDGSHEYSFQNDSAIAPGEHLPQHAPATVAESAEQPALEPTKPEVIPEEHSLSTEEARVLHDMQHSHEDTMKPMKHMQASRTFERNWDTLQPLAESLGQTKEQFKDALLGHLDKGEDISDIYSHVAPTAEASVSTGVSADGVGESGGGGAATADETAKAEPQQEAAGIDSHADTHISAADTLDISSDTVQLSPEALKGVDTVYYHPVANYGGVWNEPVTGRVALDLSPYTPEQKMQIIQLTRLMNVAAFMGENPEQHGLGVAPDVETFVAFVNKGEALSWLYDSKVDGVAIDMADRALPKTMNPQEWQDYISSNLLHTPDQRMAAK